MRVSGFALAIFLFIAAIPAISLADTPPDDLLSSSLVDDIGGAVTKSKMNLNDFIALFRNNPQWSFLAPDIWLVKTEFSDPILKTETVCGILLIRGKDLESGKLQVLLDRMFIHGRYLSAAEMNAFIAQLLHAERTARQ